MTEGLIVIVLAGQRPGTDPVASVFGREARALIPVLGRPMIDHVLRMLRRAPRVDSVILVEDPNLEPLSASAEVADALADGFATLARAKPKISESVAEVIRANGPERSYLVTTADNPLLSEKMIDDFLDRAKGADIAVGMVEKAVIERAYPNASRTYFRFRDAAVSGANLFYISGERAIDVIGLWAHMEQHRKRPLKLFAQFGWLNLAMLATRRLTLEDVFRRLSERVGCTVRPAQLPFAEAAMDVDKIEDLRIAEGIITRERAKAAPRTLAPKIAAAGGA